MNKVEALKALHVEMRKFTIECKINEEIYDKFLPEKLESLSEDDLDPYYNLFTRIRRNQYKAYFDVRILLSDEIWQRYRDFDIRTLREQVLLKQAAKNIRMAWKPLIQRVREKNGKAKETKSVGDTDSVDGVVV